MMQLKCNWITITTTQKIVPQRVIKYVPRKITSKLTKHVTAWFQPQTSSAIFKCRTCQGEHWTVSCPFQHTQMAQNKANEAAKAAGMYFTCCTTSFVSYNYLHNNATIIMWTASNKRLTLFGKFMLHTWTALCCLLTCRKSFWFICAYTRWRNEKYCDT